MWPPRLTHRLTQTYICRVLRSPRSDSVPHLASKETKATESHLGRIHKYTILSKIGQGAMGEVFKARDTVLDRYVALKTIARALDRDDSHKERFQREAQAAGRLAHPNITTVYDYGEETEKGIVYIAMELLEGTDLHDLIEKRAVKSLTDKLAIMEEICDGLAFAHVNGVVHRDLKPGNIHVLDNGHVKIMDFGLARRMEEDPARTAVIMGTPYYMAPEQAIGERATIRSDVFALGAVFYELIAGRRPFAGDSIPSVLFSVVHHEPKPLAAVVPEAPALVAFVEKALAKDPQARYADAGEMREALRDVRASLETGAPRHPRPEAARLSDVPRPPRPASLSEAPDTDPAVKEAIGEIHEYLADRTPPLMVADSVALVMNALPGGLASDLYVWAEHQRESQRDVPLADLAFHALRKLHLIGEFRLVDSVALSAHVQQVGDAMLELFPADEREGLKRRLARLGESEMVRTGPIGLLHRGPGDRAASAEAATGPSLDETLAGGTATSTMRPDEVQHNLRRLSLLEERLQQGETGPVARLDEPTRSQLISETLAAAASQAQTEKEFEEHLRRLRPLGVASGADEVFRSLGRGISEWVIPPDVTPWQGVPRIEVEAMRRIIALAEEPIEMARRFRHLVYAAIEQFNEGNLGRAVTMFELATSLYEERKIDAGFVETVQRKGHESLEMRRMRQYLGQSERHPQLRVVLSFFTFLGHAILLDELQSEARRDRRRFLLDMLEVHGAPARAAARDRLRSSGEGDEPGAHIQRNWIYLMRVIPRPPEEPGDEEIAVVARFASPGQPAFLAREAIMYLGQTKHVKAKQCLVDCLHDHEAAFSRRAVAPSQQKEWQAALDKIGGALARFGAPSAWTALVDHALTREPAWGPTMDRLTELGSQDLSGSPDVVTKLVDEMRSCLPRGMLSLLSRRDHDLICLVDALAGTPSPEVRQALQEIAEAHPGTSFGKAAQRVFESFTAPPVPPGPPNLAGEVDSLALPGLLVRVSQGRSSGLLTLYPREGGAAVAVGFNEGTIVSAKNGHLAGEDAIYQLLERPFAGTFVFEGGAAPEGTGIPLPEVTSLVGEGVRRSGELPRASALVPDDASLQATGSRPTSISGEIDYPFVVSLWEKACAGLSPRRLESELPADAFRIRRALGQWVEDGALRIVSPDASASGTGT
jgi:serine/threonine protein kinase